MVENGLGVNNSQNFYALQQLQSQNGYAQYAQSENVPPQLLGGVRMHEQPAQDCYEKSGNGIGTGVLATAGGATVGGAVGYYLKGNPVSIADNKLILNENFVKTYDAAKLEEYTNKIIEKRKLNALSSLGIKDLKEYDAIKQLATAEKIEDLAEDVRKNLPKEITTPEAANEFMKKAEPKLAKVDPSKIRETAKKSFMLNYSKEALQTKINNFNAMEESLTKLGKDATPEQLKEFINSNKSKFGIANEKRLNSYVQKLSKMTQEELLNEIKAKNTGFKTAFQQYSESVLRHVDSKDGKLLKNASKEITEMFKNFKWSQAKRLGLWGAGFGALFSLLLPSKD